MAKRTRAVRGLGTVGIEELQAEMSRRQRGAASLQKKYEKAAAKAANLARPIEALGGTVDGPAGRGRTGRGRPRNDQSLGEHLVQVLKGKELGIPEIITAVQKMGYKSTAANFRSIVSQALVKINGIKRVARGIYTAK